MAALYFLWFIAYDDGGVKERRRNPGRLRREMAHREKEYTG
jgi:hypothetical protein